MPVNNLTNLTEQISKTLKLMSYNNSKTHKSNQNKNKTRMHSNRMRTARSLTVSHRKNHACPPEKPYMPPEQPSMPPRSNHAHPPQQPCMPPPWEQPCMPPRATTHAPPVDRMTDTCKNITFANFVCRR